MSTIKKLAVIFDLIINYGVSPLTIINSKKPISWYMSCNSRKIKHNSR